VKTVMFGLIVMMQLNNNGGKGWLTTCQAIRLFAGFGQSITRQGVYYLAARYDIGKKTAGHWIFSREGIIRICRERVKEEYPNGWLTILDIMRITGKSYSAVYEWVKRHKAEIRTHKRVKYVEPEKAEEYIRRDQGSCAEK